MSDISQVKLPSGAVFDIKDAVARQSISGGVSFIVAWGGTSTPVVADIPEGVVVRYNDTNYTGTLTPASATSGAFYLVKSATQPSDDSIDVYDEYVVIKPTSTSSSWFWEKIGDTRASVSGVVTDVAVSGTANALSASSTFTVTQPTVTLSPNSVVTAIGSPTTDSAIKTLSVTTKDLETASVAGVSGSTTASRATVGSPTAQTTADGTTTSSSLNTEILKSIDVLNEVLIIGACTLDTQTTNIPNVTFADVTVPIAATATTVATGKIVNSDTSGDAVVTAVSSGSTVAAVTGSSPTTSTITATASGTAVSASGTAVPAVTGITVTKS